MYIKVKVVKDIKETEHNNILIKKGTEYTINDRQDRHSYGVNSHSLNRVYPHLSKTIRIVNNDNPDHNVIIIIEVFFNEIEIKVGSVIPIDYDGCFEVYRPRVLKPGCDVRNSFLNCLER